ncbi:MAG: nucleotide exchange factor GrpE [Patescibacteria group bacterium]|nr:nucleotide exchange factor GrpE [Patescibacteria group bacterium]
MKKKKESLPKETKKGLKECQKLKDEYLAGWQRERADFLNYKKEELERVGELLKYANIGLMLKFLPILDNFEISEKKLPKKLKGDKNIKGLLQIKAQIKALLKSQGIEEIESLGKNFDPNLQEIIEIVKSPKAESGMVAEEIQKGYKIHGKVLRPAKVKVIK